MRVCLTSMAASPTSEEDPTLFCVDCGWDLSSCPKQRKKLGEDSKGSDPVARERVLSTWRELVCRYVYRIRWTRNTQSIRFQEIEMCRQCFADYDRLAKLRIQVNEKLHVAVDKFSRNSSLSGHQSTSVRIKNLTYHLQRSLDCEMRNAVLSSADSSSPVTVSVFIIICKRMCTVVDCTFR